MNSMYAQYSALSKTNNKPVREKNPNRVLGGIRGAGSETLSVVTEDGIEQKLPSLNYVRGLEMKLQELNEKVRILETQLKRGK